MDFLSHEFIGWNRRMGTARLLLTPALPSSLTEVVSDIPKLDTPVYSLIWNRPARAGNSGLKAGSKRLPQRLLWQACSD